MFGFKITVDDFATAEPELNKNKIVYLQEAVYKQHSMGLEELDLRFTDDSNDEAYSIPAGGPREVELKPGGADIKVPWTFA